MGRTVTLQGTPLELEGPELKVGDTAPNAILSKDLATETSLEELGAGPVIYSVVPSLDTPVCALQTKRFNEEAAGMPNVRFVTISCDLPVAQDRFCGAEGIDAENLVVLSDHKQTSFGKAYGTLIPGLRILCRALFVVDKDNTIQWLQYVPEVADHPDYVAALKCAASL
jgi:thiol peroxidase